METINPNDFAFAIVSQTTEAVNIAQGMIAEAEAAARAELTAEKYTLCRHCQAGLVNFLIANPAASHEEIQAETESLWETCGACTEEYHAHLDAEYQKHLESLEYSHLDGHAFNGDDVLWQNGGVK